MQKDYIKSNSISGKNVTWHFNPTHPIHLSFFSYC